MMHTCIGNILILLLSCRLVRGSVASTREVVLHKFQTKTPMKKGEVVAELTRFGKEFEISMEIYPTEYTNSNCNIMTIGTIGFARQMLKIFIYFWGKSTSENSRGIQITCRSGGSSSRFKSSEEYPLNQKITIRMKQDQNTRKEYVYTVFINDKKIGEAIKKNPGSYQKVKVKTGDSNIPAICDISNLIIRMGSERKAWPTPKYTTKTKPKPRMTSKPKATPKPKPRPTPKPLLIVRNPRYTISAGTGFYLSRCIINVFSTATSQLCFQQCLKNGHCKSFVYSKKTKTCYVNSETKESKKCELVNKGEAMYFEVY